MEVLIFENKNWSEIPKQDNPAFDFQESSKNRKEECLIVAKVLPYESQSVGDKGYVVIHVPITGDVIRRGLFWNLEDAKTFACKASAQLIDAAPDLLESCVLMLQAFKDAPKEWEMPYDIMQVESIMIGAVNRATHINS